MRNRVRFTDRLTVASSVVGAIVLVAWASEPARRVAWVGTNGFAALMLPMILDLALLLAVAIVAVLGLGALPSRLRTLGWLRAIRPLVILGGFLALAWYPPWERLYWNWHWRSHAADYEAALQSVRSGEAPLLGQLEAFPMAYGNIARLPKRHAGLGLWGRAVVQSDSTDSLAVLFMTSAWWTDNWTGYVYMARTNADPLAFGGRYYIRRQLTPHWWFVGST